MRIYLLLFILLLASCSKKDSGDSAQDAVDDVCETQVFGPCIDPIDNFSYGANQLVLTRDQSPILLIPTYKATADVEFYTSITLPEGLVINRDTGVISGTPANIQEERTYAIVIRYVDDNIKQQFDARGGGALRTFFIKIRVLDIPPANLQVSSVENTIERRGNLDDITVQNVEGGDVISYEVSPNLPIGISLNEETGEISGSPVSEQERTGYLLTAKNSGGQTSATFYIEVTGRSPENLTYLDNNISYLAGENLPRNNLPIYSGDTASSYSITPELPRGMRFSSSTGIISGNPSEIVEEKDFTITATNDWGETSTNINITTLDNITSISTGLNHTCVIRNKKVNCSGRNEFSQLGRVSSDSCLDDNQDSYPCEKSFDYVIKDAAPLEALRISSTRSSNCSLGEDSKVYCWGDNLFGQLGTNDSSTNNISPETVKIDTQGTELTGVVKIDSGNLHVCALTVLGEVYCWGDNSVGQQGNVILTQIDYAQKIKNNLNNDLVGVEDMAVGYEHTCYLKSGFVNCVGNNNFGILGNGSTTQSSSFVSVLDNQDLPLGDINSIFIGRTYSLAYSSTSGLYSWGDNSSGQLSTGNTNPRNKAGLTSPIIENNKIFEGDDSFCFIDNDTKAYCVGQNNFNFGRSTVTGINTAPIPVLNEQGDSDLLDITNISRGYSRHRCVARTGDFYCFGRNIMGQLGDETISDSLLPKKINVNQ